MTVSAAAHIRRLRPAVLLLALTGAGALPSTAYAHKLKVFAAVEEGQVRGYAFFIGGGRAQGAQWQAVAEGTTLASGDTDADGGFSFPAPAPPVTTVVTVDTKEGHIASAELSAARFGGAPSPTAGSAAPPAARAGAAGQTEAQLVEQSVQRQIAPLLERIEQMDSRLRLTDIVSGVCLILGLGGVALWARGRRRA